MPLDEVNELFNGYNVSDENYIKYIESDFLDESWEFADLYSDGLKQCLLQKKTGNLWEEFSCLAQQLS